MLKKFALSTGITGQGGASLAALLLVKHCAVHGVKNHGFQR